MRSTRLRGRAYVLLAIVLLLTLAACQEPIQPPVMTVVPLTPQGKATTPARQVLPQVVTGGGNTSPVATPAPTALPVVTPEATPKPRMTVWRPREIAAQVQVALANTLGVKPEDVPWVRFERSVDPAKFTCLDQLAGNIPTFGEGEALVYQYKNALLYVISSQGKIWVCRVK